MSEIDTEPIGIPKKLRVRDKTRAPGAIVDRAERAEGKVEELALERDELKFDALMGDLNILSRSALHRRLVSEVDSWIVATSKQEPDRRGKTAELIPSGFAIMILDLDGLKEINGEKTREGVEPGHDMGDAALYALGKIAVEHVRGSHDLIARIGGDEFLVIVPERIQHRLIDRMRESMIVEKNALKMKHGERWPKGLTKDGRTPGEVSIGYDYKSRKEIMDILIRLRKDQGGKESEFITELVKMADEALFEDKAKKGS